MKEKWFARFKEERSLKGIFGKTNSLALEKVALVGGTRDRNESTTVTGTLFFRLTREGVTGESSEFRQTFHVDPRHK